MTRNRWLILLSIVGLLLVAAPEPIDTVAVTTFQHSAPQVNSSISALLEVQPNHQDVVADVQHIIAHHPLDPQPWRFLGDLYAAWGRPYDALDAYNQAVRRGDETAALDRSLAQLYALLGDPRKSTRYWSEYLARHPDSRAARLNLAWTAIGLADWEQARAELEFLLSDDPANPVIHAWLGLLLIGPEPMTGLPHLERATDDLAMAAILASLLDAERIATAVDKPAYRSALLGVSFLDLDVSAMLQLSELHFGELGCAAREALENANVTLALRSLLAATYRSPTYADAYAYLGQALDQLGWSDWARASLQYALRLAPQSPVVQTLVGLYWDRRGAPALARHFYEVAYDQDQNNAALCLEIAETYAAEGEYTATELWLHYAVDIAPDNPEVWKTLAHFYLDSGIDVAESGLSAARRLLELAPEDPRAYDLIGWAYYLTEEDALARENLTQALVLNPTLASAHYHLGRLHARQGRHAEASQDYRRAADYDWEGLLTAELERAWDDLSQAYRDKP